MAIEVTQGGTLVTGPHVNVQRWITLKTALKIEKIGMKVRRGFNARKTVATELNVSSRMPYDELINLVQAKIDAVLVTANAQEEAKKALTQ